MPALSTRPFAHAGTSLAVMGAFGALALGLTSCLGSDEKGGGTPRASLRFSSEILLNTPPSGSEPGTLVLRSVEYFCEDEMGDPLEGEPNVEVSVDTSRYVITGGKLYTWEEGECWATVQTGSSTALTGTWTIDPNASEVKVPAAYRDAHCQSVYDECALFEDCPDEVAAEEEILLQNMTAVSRVTADSIHMSLDADVCYASFIAGLFFVTGPVVATVEGCTSTTLKNEETDETATFTSSAAGDVHTITFKHKGSTCSMEAYEGIVTANTNCSEVPETSYNAFLGCVIGSGFFDTGDMPLEKKSLETLNEALDLLKGKNLPFDAGR